MLIYNPTAGKLKRNDQLILHRTIAALEASGFRATPVPTTGPRAATSLARTVVDRGADLVIALGGDGTINEVANGLVGSSVPLAILPGGTANCLGIETGMGTDPVRAAARLRDCVPRRIALGKLISTAGERYFLSMAGVGLDAHIVSEVNPKIKRAAGKLAYWVAGMKRTMQPLEEFRVRIDGIDQSCGFVLASRLRNYGGDLSIATGASLLSNRFETLLFTGSNPLRYIAYMLAVVVRQHKRLPGVTTRPARSVEFLPLTSQVVYVQADGELAGTLPARIEIVDDALTLLTPPGLAEREARYLVVDELARHAALSHP